MGPNLGFEKNNIVLGAGDVLYSRRGASTVTVTPKAATTPTTTLFTVVTADKDKLRLGDVLLLASDTPAYTKTELSTAPRVTAITANGSDWDIEVTPAFGSAPTAGSASVQLLYKMLGATDGGIKINFNVTRNKQYIDQSPYPVAAPVDKIEGTIVVPLAEQLASHFALALGVLPGADETTFELSGNPDLSREDRIATVTPGPNGTTRYAVAQRCVSEGEASLSASKTDKGIINLNLSMMPDTDYGADGLIGMVCA